MEFRNLVVASCVFVSTLAFSEAAITPLKDYTEVTAFIHEVAKNHPESTQLFTLGTSNTGQVIEGIQIGHGPIPNLLVSTHHGNEYGSTEVARGFIDELSKNPIANQTLYVIPVLNISGYNARERAEIGNDPNRDYPGPCGTSGPFNLNSTHALANFIADKGIVMSATLHTFAPAVLYPWGISTSGNDLNTPYTDFFKQLGQAAAQESHYAVGNSTELIYPADGTFEDYSFWKHGIWSMLFELGTSHEPSDSDVDEMVKVNVPGLRRMYEMSPVSRAEKHDFTGHCETTRGPRRTNE